MSLLSRIWRLERAWVGKDGLTEAGLGRKDGHRLWSSYTGYKERRVKDSHFAEDRLACMGMRWFEAGWTG